MIDNVNHPKHYTENKFLGHECIDFSEKLGFNIGNAFKYVFRAEYKGKPLEDIDKAIWYINRHVSNKIVPGYMHISDILNNSIIPEKMSVREQVLLTLLKDAMFNEYSRTIKALNDYRNNLEIK